MAKPPERSGARTFFLGFLCGGATVGVLCVQRLSTLPGASLLSASVLNGEATLRQREVCQRAAAKAPCPDHADNFGSHSGANEDMAECRAACGDDCFGISFGEGSCGLWTTVCQVASQGPGEHLLESKACWQAPDGGDALRQQLSTLCALPNLELAGKSGISEHLAAVCRAYREDTHVAAVGAGAGNAALGSDVGGAPGADAHGSVSWDWTSDQNNMYGLTAGVGVDNDDCKYLGTADTREEAEALARSSFKGPFSSLIWVRPEFGDAYRRAVYGIVVGSDHVKVPHVGVDSAVVAEGAPVAKSASCPPCMPCLPTPPKAGGQPRAGQKSLFISKDEVISIEASDRLGGPEQAGKKLTVDDIIFGYDVLYESRQLFNRQRWNGMMMLQDPQDAFALNDFLWTEQPDVMIELGTAYGGSAVFFAQIMLAYNPRAHVITIDPVDLVRSPVNVGRVKAHNSPLWGTAIRALSGDPIAPTTVSKVTSLIRELNATNVFINEDSVHEHQMVLNNVEAYHDLLRPCGWILFQDTKMSRFDGRKGPIWAQRQFLNRHPGKYHVDRRWEYLVYTQHAQGWVQKKGQKCLRPVHP